MEQKASRQKQASHSYSCWNEAWILLMLSYVHNSKHWTIY